MLIDIQQLEPGTTVKRGAIVLKAVLDGWRLIEHPKVGTLLLASDNSQAFVVPPNVLKLLVASRAIIPAPGHGSGMEH